MWPIRQNYSSFTTIMLHKNEYNAHYTNYYKLRKLALKYDVKYDFNQSPFNKQNLLKH